MCRLLFAQVHPFLYKRTDLVEGNGTDQTTNHHALVEEQDIGDLCNVVVLTLVSGERRRRRTHLYDLLDLLVIQIQLEVWHGLSVGGKLFVGFLEHGGSLKAINA